MWRHRHMGHPLAIVTSHLPIVPTGIHGRMMLRSARVKGIAIIRLRPVNQIMCHVLARGWVRWLRYFTEAKAEVKYRASARIRGPKHDTRFEWPVSILIVTHSFPSKLTKQVPQILVYLWSPAPFDSAVTAGARPPDFECMHLLLRSTDWWRHYIVFFDRTDNLNPQWMQAVNG